MPPRLGGPKGSEAPKARGPPVTVGIGEGASTAQVKSMACAGGGHAFFIHQELFVSLFTVEGRPLIGHLELKNTNSALQAARPRVADRPAGGWPSAGRIVMTS